MESSGGSEDVADLTWVVCGKPKTADGGSTNWGDLSTDSTLYQWRSMQATYPDSTERDRR